MPPPSLLDRPAALAARWSPSRIEPPLLRRSLTAALVVLVVATIGAAWWWGTRGGDGDALQVAPALVDFGDQPVNTAAPARTVTVTSAWEGELALTVVATGAQAADFQVNASACTAGPLLPGGSCEVQVAFTPGGTGTRTAQLSLSGPGMDEPLVVPLSGAGAEPRLGQPRLQPGIQAFGEQPVSSGSPAASVVLTNTSITPLPVTAVTVEGTHREDFQVTGEECTAAPLPPGGSCAASVSFTPTAEGDRTAALTFAAPSLPASPVVPLSGRAVPPPATQPAVSPRAVDFGGQQVASGSPGRTVTLTNRSSQSLAVSSVTVGGRSAADFAVTGTDCSGRSLPAGGSCTATVRFTPTAVGPRSGVLSFGTPALGGTPTVSLAGTGTPAAAGRPTIAPSGLDFGAQALGSTAAARSVTVTAPAGTELRVTGVSAAGAAAGDFRLGGSCSGRTLAPGASCAVSVAFAPSAAGPRTASLSVSVAGDELLVPLRGTGVDAPPVLSLPPDLTAEATSAAGASVSFSATARDARDGAREVSCTPASGSPFGFTPTTVSCSATDTAGGTASGSFTVTVRDTEGPVIVGADDVTVEATSTSGAEVTLPSVTASDAVDGTVTPTCTGASGLFPVDTTEITCTATDSRGNTSTASYDVVVADTTDPVFTSSGTGVTVPVGTPASYTAPTAEDLAQAVEVSCDPPPGTVFDSAGDQAITCTADDGRGNTATTTLTVTVTPI